MKASLLSRQRLATSHFIWIAPLCLLVTGCMADQTVWRYAPDSYPVANKSLTQKRLVVLPFQDSRPDSNINAMEIIYIPLIPFGWVDLSFPEAGHLGSFPHPGIFVGTIQPQQFKPKETFARAAAEELRASGLFKEVVFAPRTTEEDLVLHGEVTSTRYYTTLWNYGLSVFAGFPWLIGLPAGTVTNELAIGFHLDDRVTGAVLWRKKYHDSSKTTYWMPYNLPRHFNYDTLCKAMLRDVVESLRAELVRQP